jgi:murein L,D-transpeptidase YafK
MSIPARHSGIATVLLLGLLSAGSSRSAASFHADRIVIEKHDHRLTLFRGATPLKTYPVALGSQSGRKQCEGDHRTPEGMYVVDSRIARSAFHRALHLSYPNATDRKAARQAGCDPGAAIMIHGAKNGFDWLGRLHRFKDWTAGCVAVTNDEIDEIWNAVPNGIPVEIRP